MSSLRSSQAAPAHKILAKAKADRRQIQKQQRKVEAARAKERRIQTAWDRVRYYADPYVLPDDEKFWRLWTGRLRQLGRALKREKLADRLDHLIPGDDAKNYAVQVYRCAVEDDAQRVTELLMQALPERAGCSDAFRMIVNEFLRRGLMAEILGHRKQFVYVSGRLWAVDSEGNAIIDPILELIERCKCAEGTLEMLEMLHNLPSALAQPVKDLWDKAVRTFGAENGPPPMPSVRDKLTGLTAVGTLLRWLDSQRNGGRNQAEPLGEQGAAETGEGSDNGKQRRPARRKPGRPPKGDEEAEQKLYDDWKASGLPTIKDFARERGLQYRDVKATVERIQTWIRRRTKKKPPTN
jgi:hypothetical protein